jgi:tRNA-dihydrouridine synthase 3
MINKNLPSSFVHFASTAFKCKRHFENEKKKQDEKEAPSAAESTAQSFTPIDKLKMRKLVDFSNKVYIAPLTTVGNLPFRRIMKDYDADITCGEMAVVTNLLEGKPSEWALLKRHQSEDVFGIQLAAAHPDQYTRVSELIETYCDVDFVDLNLGCPLDLLCNKGAGAALMMRDKKLQGALEGMSDNLSCSITVKMRTGWDMNKPFAHQLVPKIQSWGIKDLAAVMVHGRSRLQRYKAEADWDYISKVEASESNDISKIPIIGNGDIFSYSEYEEKVLGHPNLSNTAMLGRGALVKPWLPREIKEKRNWDISAPERLDILKDFVKYGLEHWGSDQQGVNNTRRFLLEWLSFLHRYVPVGLLEVLPQKMNQRPPLHMMGRNDLETLFLSPLSSDWVKISEMLLGPVPDDFQFEPKHKASGYVQNG